IERWHGPPRKARDPGRLPLAPSQLDRVTKVSRVAYVTPVLSPLVHGSTRRTTSRHTRSTATLIAATGLLTGTAPAAGPQSLAGPPALWSALVSLGSLPPGWAGSCGVATLPVPGPPRPDSAAEGAAAYPSPDEGVGVAQPVMIPSARPVEDRPAVEAAVGVRS